MKQTQILEEPTIEEMEYYAYEQTRITLYWRSRPQSEGWLRLQQGLANVDSFERRYPQYKPAVTLRERYERSGYGSATTREFWESIMFCIVVAAVVTYVIAVFAK